MNNKGNIEFFPHKNQIKYNAIRKFKDNIIKIPSYVINEVFRKKMTIHIYHKDRYQRSFNYDNLFSYIKGIEEQEYQGVFRQKDITYKLARVEVRKRFKNSKQYGRNRCKVSQKHKSSSDRRRSTSNIHKKV